MAPIVSVQIGMTLKILKDGKDTFQNIRPEIRIDNIDCGGNIKKQLEMAEQAIHTTWSKLSDLIEKQVKEELGFSKSESLKGGDEL